MPLQSINEWRAAARFGRLIESVMGGPTVSSSANPMAASAGAPGPAAPALSPAAAGLGNRMLANQSAKKQAAFQQLSKALGSGFAPKALNGQTIRAEMLDKVVAALGVPGFQSLVQSGLLKPAGPGAYTVDASGL